jgi:ABC-type thiamin/hydroxymethylpyrimidine transport system permease subunit
MGASGFCCLLFVFGTWIYQYYNVMWVVVIPIALTLFSRKIGLGLWCLTPLSIIFQLYRVSLSIDLYLNEKYMNIGIYISAICNI